ncbi:MAG: ABC transporter permease, partial [Magnetococcales bacterium]|nr:ABC transporter permease [Magnetococcales bacterium]
MSVFLMPLWMLSGAIFPLDNAPDWLWSMMIINPVTHALHLIRMPFYHTPEDLFANPAYQLAFIVAVVWAVGCLALAMKRVHAVERGA